MLRANSNLLCHAHKIFTNFKVLMLAGVPVPLLSLARVLLSGDVWLPDLVKSFVDLHQTTSNQEAYHLYTQTVSPLNAVCTIVHAKIVQ